MYLRAIGGANWIDLVEADLSQVQVSCDPCYSIQNEVAMRNEAIPMRK